MEKFAVKKFPSRNLPPLRNFCGVTNNFTANSDAGKH